MRFMAVLWPAALPRKPSSSSALIVTSSRCEDHCLTYMMQVCETGVRREPERRVLSGCVDLDCLRRWQPRSGQQMPMALRRALLYVSINATYIHYGSHLALNQNFFCTQSCSKTFNVFLQGVPLRRSLQIFFFSCRLMTTSIFSRTMDHAFPSSSHTARAATFTAPMVSLNTRMNSFRGDSLTAQ